MLYYLKILGVFDMAKKTIMLVCSAGMSTSLLVTKCRKLLMQKGLDTDIFAVSASEADQHLESKRCERFIIRPSSSFHERRF